MVHLKSLLCSFPRIYLSLLRLKKNFNAEKAMYLRLLKPGDTVVELGANVGEFTELFAWIVGRHGRVEAFEPVSTTCDLLRARLTSGKISNVNIYRFAASDTAGKGVIYLPGATHGHASLRDQSSSANNSTHVLEFEVETVRLDNFLTEVNRIDFVKMDIEGAELMALRGMAGILRSQLPLLHIEVAPILMASFGYEAKDLEECLRGFGYSHFYAYDKSLVQIAALGDIDEPRNILASRRSML